MSVTLQEVQEALITLQADVNALVNRPQQTIPDEVLGSIQAINATVKTALGA